jgi:hypothetical protein
MKWSLNNRLPFFNAPRLRAPSEASTDEKYSVIEPKSTLKGLL